MAASKKAKNVVDQAKGMAKEKTGKATGNRTMQAKGRAGRSTANLKQAGENVKDALKS